MLGKGVRSLHWPSGLVVFVDIRQFIGRLYVNTGLGL